MTQKAFKNNLNDAKMKHIVTGLLLSVLLVTAAQAIHSSSANSAVPSGLNLWIVAPEVMEDYGEGSQRGSSNALHEEDLIENQSNFAFETDAVRQRTVSC